MITIIQQSYSQNNNHFSMHVNKFKTIFGYVNFILFHAHDIVVD